MPYQPAFDRKRRKSGNVLVKLASNGFRLITKTLRKKKR